MGIESDQVVYEYLSRVGDVAHQRQLPSSARMRLVSELRNEIDRRRARTPVDSPAAVRRILDRLGSPDDVVAAAAGGGGAPRVPDAAVPVQRDAAPREGDGRTGRLRRAVPRARSGRTEAPPPSDAASSPHRAPAHELGDSATQPDWWRTDSSPFGVGDEVPGFVGGVEIPELLKPPPRKDLKDPKDAEDPKGSAAPADRGAQPAADVPDEPAPARRRLPSLGAGNWSNPLLLIAAGALVVGAVLGNWFALLLGWLIAYASRRLTQAESKWAVVWLPGLAVASGLVWLWGRTDGRWGTPIADGQMNDALAQTWPWVVRGAAVASALFLVWRSQRSR
ncbi:hypothetical protein ACFC00_14820 [Streptomyces adustus]|uniref:hypothetical protein n=1 Tax=Streptomyces adustus TaxID=1609272 RepID=UPI0035D8DFD0